MAHEPLHPILLSVARITQSRTDDRLHVEGETFFGPAGEGYFRLSAFNSRANIDEAIGRIRKAFG